MDKTELLIKLGVDSSGASKQISEINKELKSMDKELKSLDTSTDNFSTNMSNMGKKADVAKNKITALQAKLDAQNKALEQANKKYQNALKAQERYNNGTEKSASETAKHKKAVEQAASQVNKYNREIADTERALNSANQELAEMNAQIAKMPYEKMAKGFQNVSDGLGKVSQATKPLTVALGGIATASINTAMSFEDSMAKISATTGATGYDLEKLEEKAREIGKTTSLSAEEGATALLYLSQAGYDTEQSLASVDDVVNLAIAANMDLGEATKIVTANLASYKIEVDNANRVTDVLAQTASSSNTNVQELGQAFEVIAPVAGALGYTIEDTSLALALLANNAITGSSAGTALRSVMSKLVDPTKEVSVAMEQYGISLVNSDGSAKSLKDVLLNLKEAFSTLDETQKAELASTLAGQEGMSALLAIVNSSDADFNKLSEAIGNANGKTQEMADIMAETSKGGLKELLSKLQEAFITIGQKLLPIFDKVVDKLGEVLDWFNSLDEGVQDNIIKWGLFIAGISPVTGALSKLSSGLGNVVGKIGELAKGKALEETASGMTTVATNATSLSGIIGKGASGLVGSLGAFATNLGLLVGGGALVAGVGLGIAGLITGFKNLKQAQEEAMLKKDEMTLRAEEADKALYDSFHETYEGMQQDAQNFYDNTVPLISEVFASLKEGGEGDLSALETAVKTHSEEIKNSIYTTTSGLITDLTTFNDNIYNMTIFTSEQIQALMEKRNGDYVNGVDEATTKYLEILNKKSQIGQEIIDENGQTIIYTEEMWQQECQQGLEEYNKDMLDLQAGFSDDRLQLQKSFLQETDIQNQAQYDKAIKDLDDNYEEQLGIIDDRYQERLATINSFSDEELAVMGTSRDEQIKIAQGLRDSEIAEATIMKQDTLEQYVQMARDSGIMSDEIADEFLENIERMRAENYGKIASIQDDINSLQGKTVDVTVVFNTQGYDAMVRQMNHVSTSYGGKYGYDPALNDYTAGVNAYNISPYADFFGGMDAESYPTFDFYGLKDTGVKTLSLESLGLDTVSSYATGDSNATGNISNVNYNNAHTTVIHNVPSNNAPMLDILSGIYELLARMNPELNIYTSNPSDEEIVNAVNRYMHIHGKKRW